MTMFRLFRRLRHDRADRAERERDTAAFREELKAHRRAAEREVARLRKLPVYDGGFFDATLFRDFPSDPRKEEMP